MLLETGSSCEGLEWLALTACSCVCWDPCSLSRDVPFSLSCPCNQENRHKTTRGHLLQELLSFPFGPVCTWSVYLAEEFLMKLLPARGATSLLVTWFPVSLSPLCLCSLCPRLDAVHHFCVSAVCWGQAAFIFVLQLEADTAVPVWPDLPVWGWKVLVCYSGVMDQLWAAPSVCFRKGLVYLQQRSFSFSHALQHSKGRSVQVNKILKLIFWTVFSSTLHFPLPLLLDIGKRRSGRVKSPYVSAACKLGYR